MYSAKARSSQTCRASKARSLVLLIVSGLTAVVMAVGSIAPQFGDLVKSFFAPVAAPVAVSAPVEMPVNTVANITPLVAPAASTQSALAAVNAALTAVPAAPSNTKCVTSEPGDTLSKFSAILGKSPSELARIGGLSNINMLPIGKTICVGGSASAAPATNAVAAAYHPTGNSAGERALAVAKQQLGKPYIYGASGPGAFDCSGLTSYSFKQVGVSIPRTAAAQSVVGTPVSKANLQPGDLVFFYSPVSHVGFYLGGGKVLHASTSGQPVKISDLSSMPFHNARRI